MKRLFVNLKNFVKNKYNNWMCRKHDRHVPTMNKVCCVGASFKSTCSICGKSILMDRQGKWFTIF